MIVYEDSDDDFEEDEIGEGDKMETNEDKAEEDSDSDLSDSDFVEVPFKETPNYDDEDELRYLGFFRDRNSEFSRHYNLQIEISLKENEENRIIVETMREFYKELKNSYLDKLTKWIKVRITKIK